MNIQHLSHCRVQLVGKFFGSAGGARNRSEQRISFLNRSMSIFLRLRKLYDRTWRRGRFAVANDHITSSWSDTSYVDFTATCWIRFDDALPITRSSKLSTLDDRPVARRVAALTNCCSPCASSSDDRSPRTDVESTPGQLKSPHMTKRSASMTSPTFTSKSDSSSMKDAMLIDEDDGFLVGCFDGFGGGR